MSENIKEKWTTIDYDNPHHDDFPAAGDYILAEVEKVMSAGRTFKCYELLDCVDETLGDGKWILNYIDRDGSALTSGKVIRWVNMNDVVSDEE